MQVILLERVAKLGQMGDVVDVKPGYARNFLLPQKKALSASKANIEAFEGQKAQLEAQTLETKSEADAMAANGVGLKATNRRRFSIDIPDEVMTEQEEAFYRAYMREASSEA